MTSNQIHLTADIIDVRDIIARVEELESAGYGMPISGNEGLKRELVDLQSILDELEDGGGDEQWRGAWYPVTLIRESYFVDYVQELLEDCDIIPRNLPHYIHIDWERTARDIKVDYSEVTIDGVTYFYR